MILSHLDAEDGEFWRRAADVLQRHWPLDELPSVDAMRSYEQSPFTQEMRRELLDTLDMFEVLQDAEDSGLRSRDPEALRTDFPGYSGNEETEFLGYYRDLVKQGERWPSLPLESERPQ